MAIKVIGLDIAKSVFQVHGVDEAGQVVLRRRLRRAEVLKLFAGIEPALVGIEACHTAHYWAREIAALGHEVRLMPPQFVKPYIKSQKNDAADAEAICEAVQRPTMRFVPVKSAEQQAVLLMHRTRDLLIRQRSSLISATLAHFAEFGIVIQRRVRDIDRLLLLLGGTRQGLPELAREMLGILATQLREIDARIQVVEVQLMTWHRSNEVSLRLATIPGVGPITASAIVATIADARQFKWGGNLRPGLGLSRTSDPAEARSASAGSRSAGTVISAD
jgi:transposase